MLWNIHGAFERSMAYLVLWECLNPLCRALVGHANRSASFKPAKKLTELKVIWESSPGARQVEVYFSSPSTSQGMGNAAFVDSGQWGRNCRAVLCQRCPYVSHTWTITNIQPVPMRDWCPTALFVLDYVGLQLQQECIDIDQCKLRSWTPYLLHCLLNPFTCISWMYSSS